MPRRAASTRHLPVSALAVVVVAAVFRFQTFSLLTFLAVCVSFCSASASPASRFLPISHCRTCWILLSRTAHDAKAAKQPRAFQWV